MCISATVQDAVVLQL